MRETIQIADLKAKIKEFGEGDFAELIESECDDASLQEAFEKFIGLSFELIESERENEVWVWTWRIHQQFYQITGEYSSWADTEMDPIMDFYEVEPVTKTITTYERIKKN